MTVSGRFEDRFIDASHVLFTGHLDDPFFNSIAIQRIISISEKTVTLDKSGELPIKRKSGREYVSLIYRGFFGSQKTTGNPFKDLNTQTISGAEVSA